MNERERLQRERGTLRKLEFSDSRHISCVRLNSGNTLKHELLKTVIAYRLRGGFVSQIDCDELSIMFGCDSDELFGKIDSLEKGRFITEAQSKGRKGRADILRLHDSYVIEIETKDVEKPDADMIFKIREGK